VFAEVLVPQGAWPRAPRAQGADARRNHCLYTYIVPTTLQAAARPGILVAAPFGKQLVTGIIWSVTPTRPTASAAFQLRALQQILDITPILLPHQLALAEWIASYYSCSLASAVQLFLPPNLTRSERVSLRLAGEPPIEDIIGSEEQAILGLLRDRGRLEVGAIERVLGKSRARAAVAALVAAGAIEQQAELRQPRRRAGEPAVATAPEGSAIGYPTPPRFARPTSDAYAGWNRGQEPAPTSGKGGEDGRAGIPTLTNEQEAAVAAITSSLTAGDAPKDPGRGVFLLHGITGSGKTEVYLRALAVCLAHGRRGIVLVPEIALTPQMVGRFAARFPGRVAVLHSSLTDAERHREWQRIRAGAVDVVIGSRSAIFAPMPDIGLIVLDEEHESAYKQDERHPTYHARDVARRLGELTGAAVVLGSATPALESYYYAQTGRYTLLRLTTRPTVARPAGVSPDEDEELNHGGHRGHGGTQRIYGGGAGQSVIGTPAQNDSPQRPPAGTTVDSSSPLRPSAASAVKPSSAPPLADLPPVTIVDLRAELRAGNTSILSRRLRAALDETLLQGKQAILFLNRRGAASCVLCRECGYVARCGRCDVPMTYHLERQALLCHYCGRQKPAPRGCPVCGSPGIRYFGLGTQKVEQTIAKLYSHARLLRWDHDTARGRQQHEQILDSFSAHHADILIGTQIIAKGLDIPGVTLVGVISADVALFLPDIRAAERAFQLLTQVAGRAGRGQDPGQVIIQTFNPEHVSIRAAATHDYLAFYRAEIAARRRFGYPPFRRFIKFTYSHKDRYCAQVEATTLYDRLNRLIAGLELTDTDLVGPAPAFMERLRGKYRWQVIVRGPAPHVLLENLAPEDLPVGWSVDVDPLSTL
jgi:primosomal protein N' (replication factor Y)